MKELNFYQLAKKKMEFENIGVGNTALDLFEDCSADPYVQKTDPPHYQKGQIQVWDFIADQKLDYFKGNVVKLSLIHI